ncbi:MAG: BatD family protein [Alphaproteobacteria bacterium]|nr:BatD family protein [Alphaproteobacteria bacterium]
MKKIIVLGLFLIGMSLQYARAQNFVATVNRNPVPEGETFVLTLDLQDVDTQKTPDLSALSKDLTILSISNGYHTSIVNGKVSKSREWNLVMMPNQSGEIEIPEIEVDGYKTHAIKLNVISSDALIQQPQQKVAENNPKFKMTGDIDNSTPFVQQQINYRLKIYDAGGLQGEAPFFVTTNDDWVIKSLGEPKVETKVVNGMSLREIVFDYALFAQKSGDLTIPPVRFNGYYLTKSTRTDPFGRFFDDDDFFVGFCLIDGFANKNQVVLTS